MKKHRILLVIILILLMLCAIILYYFSRRVYIYEGDSQTREITEEISIVQSKNQFYIVKGCINKYYTYCSMMSSPLNYYNDDKNLEQEYINNAKVIYNMLDEEYIKYKNITEDNIYTNIEKVDESIVNIDNMYFIQKSENIYIYIVDGTLRDKATNNISGFNMIVKMDFANQSFTIMPNDYVRTKYTEFTIGGNIDVEVPEAIELNKNNKCITPNVDAVAYIRDLFNNYKERTIYRVSSVYDMLDEEYKNAKFESISEFENYIKNRYEDINSIQLVKYQSKRYDDYTQYTMIDSENNYYIFKETLPMKYTIILDTYTVDLPEFITKYKSSSIQEKVLLNLDKINQALNNSDYTYIYSKLADSFKTRNFPSLSSFESYAKTNFFNKNKFDYLSFGSEGDGAYYTYSVNITDETSKVEDIVNKTFIMLLKDGTDFEISFNK